MKRTRALLVALAAGLVAVAAIAAYSASAMGPGMTRQNLTILHSWWGCHTMTLNNSSETAGVRQHLYVRAGYAITLRNRDTCEHQLVQTAGAKDVQMVSAKDGATSDGTVAAFGTPLLVRMSTPGTYTFTTVEGQHVNPLATDVPGNLLEPSFGPDNQLDITVTVLPARTDFTD